MANFILVHYTRPPKVRRRSSTPHDIATLLLTLSVLLSNMQTTNCCGDSGSRNIIEERDWAESPLGKSQNVRSLMRRSVGQNGDRKACGKGNEEPVPLIR